MLLQTSSWLRLSQPGANGQPTACCMLHPTKLMGWDPLKHAHPLLQGADGHELQQSVDWSLRSAGVCSRHPTLLLAQQARVQAHPAYSMSSVSTHAAPASGLSECCAVAAVLKQTRVHLLWVVMPSATQPQQAVGSDIGGSGHRGQRRWCTVANTCLTLGLYAGTGGPRLSDTACCFSAAVVSLRP